MNYKALIENREKGKIGDSVFQIYCRYLAYRDYHQNIFNRTMDNWNIYLPVDTEHGYGHYPADVAAAMLRQKRAMLTFNMAKPTVDLIASGLIQAPFDPKYTPVDKPLTMLTKAMEKRMYSDKELCNWGSAYWDLVRAGCIIQGDIYLGISNEFSRLGNNALYSCLPNSVLYSPTWKTTVMRDCPDCFHEQYLMPDQAEEYYYGHEISEPLKKSLELMKTQLHEYGTRSGAVPFAGSDGSWGSAIQFVHWYHMEIQRKKRVFIVTQFGDMFLPEKICGDPQMVKMFLDKQFGFEKWDPENIYEDEIKEKRCRKTTIAPTLLGSEVIEDSYPEVQIGQIPFYTWSCDRVNGEPHGIIDQIKDAQRTINYWNSLIQHKIQTGGGGGAKYIDKSKFATPDDAEDAVQNANDPTKVFPVKPGALDTGKPPISPVQMSDGVPAEVYAHLDRIISQYWPLISKTTPASRGMLEGSNQSGYLFNQQRIQSDQMVYTIVYGLRQFWNQVYEGDLMLATQLYSNENVPRVFYFKGGKEKVVLNERVEFPDGSIGIRNDVSKLKDIRHKIIVSDQQSSPTQNMADLSVLNEYLNSMVKFANLMPAQIAYTMKAIARKIDQFDEEDKENLEEIADIELSAAMEKLNLSTINTKIETEVAKRKLLAIMNTPEGAVMGQPDNQAVPQQGLPDQNTTTEEQGTMQPALQGAPI
jgi:hypothetical protein